SAFPVREIPSCRSPETALESPWLLRVRNKPLFPKHRSLCRCNACRQLSSRTLDSSSLQNPTVLSAKRSADRGADRGFSWVCHWRRRFRKTGGKRDTENRKGAGSTGLFSSFRSLLSSLFDRSNCTYLDTKDSWKSFPGVLYDGQVSSFYFNKEAPVS